MQCSVYGQESVDRDGCYCLQWGFAVAEFGAESSGIYPCQQTRPYTHAALRIVSMAHAELTRTRFVCLSDTWRILSLLRILGSYLDATKPRWRFSNDVFATSSLGLSPARRLYLRLGRNLAQKVPPLRLLYRLCGWFNFGSRGPTRRRDFHSYLGVGSIASISGGDSKVDAASCSGTKALGEPL